MSENTEWRAEEALPGKPNGWCVEVVNLETGYDHVIMDLDKATAHRIAAVNEMEAALEHIVKEWDGEPEDMHDARMALAKARGDEPPEGWVNE